MIEAEPMKSEKNLSKAQIETLEKVEQVQEDFNHASASALARMVKFEF